MRLLCAIIAATAAFAQTPPPSKSAVIEGKVLNSLTGEPIRKAELTLTTSLLPDNALMAMDMSGFDVGDVEPPAPKPVKETKKTYSAISDASGKFRFEGVDAGDYYLQVKHAGFVEVNYKPKASMTSEGRMHVPAGREFRDLEFRLVPQGAISGKVVDEDGDPVVTAMVAASKVTYTTGHRMLIPVDTAQTNDRGEFRLGKLPPGRYYLVADPMAFNPMATVPPPPADGSPETGYVSTYFPRYTDAQEAEGIDVKAGADLPNYEIHLQKSRVVRVKGTLMGPDGKALQQAQVMLMSGVRPGSMRMSAVGADGKFEIANVPPGLYTAMTVQLFGSSDHEPKISMQPLVVPPDGISDLKFGAVPEAALNGRIILADDAKVAFKNVGVILQEEEEGAVMPVTARVEESGAFVLKKVAATSYRVNVVNLPPGTYVKSVLWNGREKLGETLDFSGGVSGDLQAILATDGGTFDVKVSRDDKPVEDATVVLLVNDAAHRNRETTRSATTNEAGHALFKDVRPGDYLAFAWEDVEDGQWFDPAFVKAAAADAARVTIAPRGNQHADLKPIAAK